MEPKSLAGFLELVQQWPSTPGESGGPRALAGIVDKLSALIGAEFVAIFRSEGAGETASRPDAGDDAEDMDLFIRKQVRRAESLFDGSPGSHPRLKQVRLESEDCPRGMRIDRLTVCNLSGPNRQSLAAARPGKSRVDFGWVVVGTQGDLTDSQQTLLLAAAQRLACLAEAAALEGAVQLRNQFLSIASHELKTPLTSIYGVLQLQERMLRLKKEENAHESRERQESFLKMVIRQTQRLNGLIDGLLDVSRIQNGRFTAEPSETDVSTLLKDVVAGRLAVIAQEAGVALTLDAPEGQRAWVDPVRMEELATNLVMNAIRFSPEGGMVRIRLAADGALLRLVVRDQGPSVPAEDRERIFRPFERAQRTARFGGLGLGLYISRQIAQLHGGDVVLSESLPGKGNTFDATLRLRQSGAQLSA